MKFLLFFTLFSLPLMAQEDKTQKGGIKDIGRIPNEPPLCIIDGKKLSRWSLKTKKLQPDEIAEILLFFREEAKNIFGNSAKYGALYIITKETLSKAEALIDIPAERKLNRRERHYREIGEFYQTYRLIVVSGKVTDKEGNPLANIKVRNNDRGTRTFTDSIGNYTIEARRWNAIQPENIEDCYLVVKEAREQSHNFVQHPPIESRNSDPRASTPSISLKTPCDKLFVLDGLPIEKKEEFLKKIRRKKIEEIIEIDEQSGVPLYGSLGAYGVIIINTKK
ncbi:TonB-dependent outer membrane receptor, SusC/RagA subfamily, signature region [Capnocytophaga gingivalis ATCC 33624]|uniref:carboxypeptidase-like regulatory domain-containing protein n=1 Tax=Capnocytophaga gingivalis TaxID=1017 RepID=UPI00019FBF9E|nr:carboxypeptidase-like regulatory domain-containing protein [Capnocytophaga gingivalis]EEK15558.1 TonB-dependent outer membrane receptor, SusC/RagA subfamily, signature region [Capnocytophaga gingivalis ATCC 33624]